MSGRCDPAYAGVIDRLFSFDLLDAESGSVIGLSGDDRIIYVNDRWNAFAAANDGQPGIGAKWDLGTPYLDAVPEVLQPFYRSLLAQARSSDSLHPVNHQYECSTPTRLRRFNMLVYAISDGSCVLIVNSLLVDRPFAAGERPAREADETQYRNAAGVLSQCCHCRRVRTLDTPPQWHWVPDWVHQSPERTSHGLCEICYAYYYPAARNC